MCLSWLPPSFIGPSASPKRKSEQAPSILTLGRRPSPSQVSIELLKPRGKIPLASPCTQSEDPGSLPASPVLISGLSYNTTFNKELWISSLPLYSM